MGVWAGGLRDHRTGEGPSGDPSSVPSITWCWPEALLTCGQRVSHSLWDIGQESTQGAPMGDGAQIQMGPERHWPWGPSQVLGDQWETYLHEELTRLETKSFSCRGQQDNKEPSHSCYNGCCIFCKCSWEHVTGETLGGSSQDLEKTHSWLFWFLSPPCWQASCTLFPLLPLNSWSPPYWCLEGHMDAGPAHCSVCSPITGGLTEAQRLRPSWSHMVSEAWLWDWPTLSFPSLYSLHNTQLLPTLHLRISSQEDCTDFSQVLIVGELKIHLLLGARCDDCNPCYAGGIGRRITIWGQGQAQAKTWDPIWKITKAKKGWGFSAHGTASA
jgi:hypothetical protein